MAPSRLRIRSFWLPEHRNNDLEIPEKGNKELRENWEQERHWGLILLRLRWGHISYELKVNKDDELELVKLGRRSWTMTTKSDKGGSI